jgi:RNA polymerase sigma-70 factor (ECF subfamily)
MVRHTSNRALQLLLRDREKYLNFLTSRIRNRDLAEEVLQSVTLKVIERGHQLRIDSRAEAWLYRVLRNALTDYHRSTANPVSAAERDSSGLEIAAPVSASNPCHCATHELRQLKPEYADALRSVEMEGTSVLEYAKAHVISPNAASVRLYRARKSLQQRIMNTCGSCAGAGCFDCSC